MKTGDAQNGVPQLYRGLGDKVEAVAEGIVGGGWLWVSPDPHRPNIDQNIDLAE